MPRIEVVLPKKLLSDLKRMAKQMEVTRAEMIRMLLRFGVESVEVEDEVECPSCGKSMPETDEGIEFEYCPHCGEKLETENEDEKDIGGKEESDEGDTEECEECGAATPADAAFCPQCGVEFEEESESDGDKNEEED